LGPSRLHALIDGVFAIAITLLVLDLPKPQHSTQLVHDLLQQWPSYVAYLVSFVTLGILWIEHHGMMGAVRSIDRRFLERTLAFLLFISVIPWPTALAADYARQGFGEARAVAILYAATMLMMGLTFAWGWRYLTLHAELVAAPAGVPSLQEPAVRCWGDSSTCSRLAWLCSAPRLIFGRRSVAVYFALSKSEVPGLIVTSSLAEDPT